MANDALRVLRDKGMQSTPTIAMGASMGSLYAAQWFATNPQVRALILIVPGSENICDLLKKSGGRPVFLIQADQDDTTFGSGAKIRQCIPNGKQYMVKGAGHNFPPDAIFGVISEWLDSLPLADDH
jgi:pimeloyl-ACP methyl ester carboxylesterase